jgi:hypothetical protein
MVRPCTHASPRAVHECYPQHSPADFFLRRQLAQAHFEHVDLFLAPSEFLLEKYVQWGIPRSKIRLEDYGRRHGSARDRNGRALETNRFAFFGQFTPFKGADVLLEAMGQCCTRAAHLAARRETSSISRRRFQSVSTPCSHAAAANVSMAGGTCTISCRS